MGASTPSLTPDRGFRLFDPPVDVADERQPAIDLDAVDLRYAERGELLATGLAEQVAKLPQLRIVPLSDNGSAYIARETATTAAALGLLAFTPVRSPQSNGISEAFVKTLKRDYARNIILPDAGTVPTLLPEWFDNNNEIHPHSGLRFLSPREFRAKAAGA